MEILYPHPLLRFLSFLYLIRRVYLNSGFPLTFTAHGIGAEGKKIQLTRALIFSSICLACLRNYNKKIVSFDDHIQKIIINEFLRITKIKHKEKKEEKK
jgi:hypothetical protein